MLPTTLRCPPGPEEQGPKLPSWYISSPGFLAQGGALLQPQPSQATPSLRSALKSSRRDEKTSWGRSGGLLVRTAQGGLLWCLGFGMIILDLRAALRVLDLVMLKICEGVKSVPYGTGIICESERGKRSSQVDRFMLVATPGWKVCCEARPCGETLPYKR